MKSFKISKCETCYKIICKKCGWEASDEDTINIQKGSLTACPVCGWKPGAGSD